VSSWPCVSGTHPRPTTRDFDWTPAGPRPDTLTRTPSPEDSIMPVISAANLKGGVGKSSLVLHGAGALARLGKRVLVVDNDPQASATAGFLGAQAARQLDPGTTIAAIHAGDEPFPELVIRPTGFDGIDLLPGSRYATRFNVPEPHEAPYEDQVRLRDFLAGVRDHYDLVWIDNPPNLHLCTYSSLAASDGYVVPVQAEDFGAQGLVDVNQSAALVRAAINPGLARVGYVLTMFAARRSIHQMYAQMMRENFGAEVFAAAMPESIDYVEALAGCKPVSHHKPRGAAAKAIQAIVEEMLARLARAGAERAGEAA
jgi:chromosome partitioning protein